MSNELNHAFKKNEGEGLTTLTSNILLTNFDYLSTIVVFIIILAAIEIIYCGRIKDVATVERILC